MNILSSLIRFILLVGITYFIVIAFRKKSLIEAAKEKKPKTTIRIIIEAIIWIALAINSIIYVYINCRGSFLYWFVEIFWMTMIGFYVYDDSHKRYLNPSWNISWAVAVGILFPLFIIYYFVKPPVVLEVSGTRFRKKLIFSILTTIAFVLLLVFLNRTNRTNSVVSA